MPFFSSFQRISALTVVSIALSTWSFSSVLAADTFLTRGEVVSQVVQHFQLETKNQNFFSLCHQHIDECVFAFSARSHFDGIQTKPLILYPDVFPAYKYYSAINTASLLQVVMGYWDQPQSPFLPEREITQVEALKMVLGAAKIYQWHDKNELFTAAFTAQIEKNNLYSTLEKMLSGSQWWYYFYTQFAQTAGMIPQNTPWNPEDKVTQTDLQSYFAKADHIAADYEKNHPSGNTSQQANSAGS